MRELIFRWKCWFLDPLPTAGPTVARMDAGAGGFSSGFFAATLSAGLIEKRMMAERAPITPDSFLLRALRGSVAKVRRASSLANSWRLRAVELACVRLDLISKWLTNRRWRFMIGLALLIWVCLMLWFFVELTNGRVQGDSRQIAVGGAIGATLVGAVLSPVAAFAIWLSLILIDKLIRVVTPFVLYVPLIVWAGAYALWQAALVVLKLFLLVPLFLLFLATRLGQLWRGIFYTCPSLNCSYRGLPAFVCPSCGAGNARLWPNLIGLLWHPCGSCGTRLPTLDLLGRGQLAKLCGRDGMPLLGRHAGRVPERLVAILGGPGSGKTSYLLMVVHRIIQGDQSIGGRIDDADQEREFWREWAKLKTGIVASKTAEAFHAFLMYAHVGGSKCQLYLYDAPGEELINIDAVRRQQYFPLLEGFVMLFDPADVESFKKLVTATVAAANSATRPDPSGKLPFRVSVVISKADSSSVRDAIGDLALGESSPERCRAALVGWGARNAVMVLESQFTVVNYFACSPLGRATHLATTTPFVGYGVLEPLASVLSVNNTLHWARKI